MPFYQSFFGEGSPTKINYRKKGSLILTSLLEDLVVILGWTWQAMSFEKFSKSSGKPAGSEKQAEAIGHLGG